MTVNNELHLGVGNISHDRQLNAYYQDFTPAIYHFENNSLEGGFDENGIPYLQGEQGKYYSFVYIIQYALIKHDLLLKNIDVETGKAVIQKCLDWLEETGEDFFDSTVWRSEEDKQYSLKKGWVSAMYQGQAISLFLRGYQLFGTERYLTIAEKIFKCFKYDYSEGGVKRIDDRGYIWFEEYPTSKPSLVLNGFIYTMFGFYDLYRVTGSAEAKKLFDDCVSTLENNLYKYDIWYWSVYDQLKEQLVSYYYQKNVHIPLMQIMHQLTGKEIFERYAEKWTKNLNNPVHQLVVKIMYRVQPRIKKWIK